MMLATKIEQTPYGQHTQVKVYSKDETRVILSMATESDMSNELFMELIVSLHGPFDVILIVRRQVEPDDAGTQRCQLRVTHLDGDELFNSHFIQQPNNGSMKIFSDSFDSLLDQIWDVIGTPK